MIAFPVNPSEFTVALIRCAHARAIRAEQRVRRLQRLDSALGELEAVAAMIALFVCAVTLARVVPPSAANLEWTGAAAGLAIAAHAAVRSHGGKRRARRASATR